MLLDAVNREKLTIEQVTRLYSERPARLLGLFPRKGSLSAGADADLAIVDMQQEHTLSNAKILSKAGWTPFDGLRVKGRPVMTLLRGTVVAENGRITAPPGTGRYVSRKMT
jgi:dihydroorotase